MNKQIVIELEGDVDEHINDETVVDWGNSEKMVAINTDALDGDVYVSAMRSGSVKVSYGDDPEAFFELPDAEIISATIQKNN